MAADTNDLPADLVSALDLLIAIRIAWRPEAFDLIALVGGTRAGPGNISFDGVAELDDHRLSETLAWMSPGQSGGFEDLVSKIEPSWRLALLQAYAQRRHSGIPSKQVLVPTKPLSTDKTGHFVPMQFHV